LLSREILTDLCPAPIQICGFYHIKKAQLLNQNSLYKEKFQQMLEYVEINKKFPEFKEDFAKIKKDPEIFNIFRKLQRMEISGYDRNKAYITKKFPSSENPPNLQILLDFLSSALDYQRENLAWFTKSQWFNKNSSRIFEHLAVCEKVRLKKKANAYHKKNKN